eukprot:scaffold394060_cov35-Attheya_sp.AAC.1
MTTEDALQKLLISHPPRPYTQLAAREWYDVPGRADLGKGDVVLKNPKCDQYLVVETKVLPEYYTGHNATVHRNHMRSKVWEQAHTYGMAWKQQHPSASVEMATYTNLDGLQKLGKTSYIMAIQSRGRNYA